MKITNRLSLPHAVVRAAENDAYSKDGADFTSSQLPNPPRAEALKFANPESLEIDASSRLQAMLGQAIHGVLERGARPDIDIIEKRYFGDFCGVRLGGKIDLYQPDDKTLYEYKSCLAGAFTKKNGSGKKPEWVAQASVNKLLMEMAGVQVDRVVIVGWLLDWRNWNKNEPGYPEAAVVQREIETWPKEKTLEYINTRLTLHREARQALPNCTSKETWGGKMCESYCEASTICAQYQQSKKTGLIEMPPEKKSGWAQILELQKEKA